MKNQMAAESEQGERIRGNDAPIGASDPSQIKSTISTNQMIAIFSTMLIPTLARTERPIKVPFAGIQIVAVCQGTDSRSLNL